MNNQNDGKFSVGLLLGIILGGGAVFLFGTRTGKNLLKIVTEQGIDGLMNLLEEYNLDDLSEYEEVDGEEEADFTQEVNQAENREEKKEEAKAPKKRFFKRVRK